MKIALLSLACIAGSGLAIGAEPGPFTVRVMAQESLPPKWMTRDGHADGYCPAVLAAIEQLEPRLRFTGLTNYRSLPMIERGLETGTIDCACALLDTGRRRKIANVYQQPLYMVRERLAAAAEDTAAVDNYADLIKLRPLITTARGAGYSDQLRKLGLEVDDSTGDNLVNLKKIIAGHGRYFYMNELTMNWIVREYHLGDKVRVLPVVLREQPIYFWTSMKTNPETARLVDQALAKLKASGELARIYERWSAER